MIKLVISKPNWSKSHPLNDLVLAYDVMEHKLVYANHYEDTSGRINLSLIHI